MSSASAGSDGSGSEGGGGGGGGDDGAVEEEDLDAFLAAQDAEAMRKRQVEQEVVFAAPAGSGDALLNDVEYDEDDPDDFLAQQDAIALARRRAGTPEATARPASPVLAAAAAAIGGGVGRGDDEVFVEQLAAAVGGLCVGDGDAEAGDGDSGGAQTGVTVETDGDSWAGGVRSRRSSAAPIGLVIREEEECQSRGMMEAVKAGLVAPESVLEVRAVIYLGRPC
jgi:hypothetical protein